MSGARVLVTGASGFLGGYLVRELQATGHEVFGHGRNATALSAVVDEQHRWVGSLASLAATPLAVDAVVHCAALSSPWGTWRAFYEANVEGTAHVAEFARRNGVTRVVFVSSPSVYAARHDRLNIREDDVDPHNRLNGYIRSKIAAEQLLHEAHQRGVIPELLIVRPRGLIGVGDPSLLPRLLAVHKRLGLPLFNDGRNLLDVTAVENVAFALRLALTEGNSDGGVYNITNGEPRAFRDIVSTLFALLGESPRFVPRNRRVLWAVAGALEGVCSVLPGRPEPPLTRYSLSTIAYAQTLDISRARSELGYHPRVSIDEALGRVAHALRSAG